MEAWRSLARQAQGMVTSRVNIVALEAARLQKALEYQKKVQDAMEAEGEY